MERQNGLTKGTEIDNYIDTNERLKINYIFPNIIVDNFSVKYISFTNTEKNFTLVS